MKNLLGYILLAIVLYAAGCSKPAIDLDSGIPMIFGAEEAVAESRTLLDGTSVNQDGNQLTVYDRYTPENGNAVTYMDGTEVICNGSVWTYSPLKYWTKTGKHSFMAYLSKHNDIQNYPTVTYSDETEILDIGSDMSPWEITIENQFDFLYSCYTRYMNELNPHRPVEFQLNHLLCAVQFNVVNLMPLDEVTFNGFSLKEVYHTGYAVIEKDESADKNAVVNINTKDNTTVHYYNNASQSIGFNNTLNVFAGVGKVGEDGYLLLWPHDTKHFTGAKAVISYKYGSIVVENKEIDLSAAETKSWHPGDRYVYNFYIQDNRISFDVKVVPWVVDDVIIEE